MSKIFSYIIIFFGIVLTLLVIADREFRNASAEVVFLDIGQGDAILIQQGTTQILIDGGPDAGVVEKLGNHMPFWDRKIELVIMSHAHADHYAGLIDVVDRFEVAKFMWSGAEEHEDDFDVFMEMLATEHCEVLLAAANEDIVFGAVTLDVLFPFTARQFIDQPEENLNNTSIVIRVVGPNISVMLTGDAEKEVETELISRNAYLPSDILKAGHHGSKTSSLEEFVRVVAPRRAVFCAGEDNKFNHPAELIVERYHSMGIETLTLFETGDIMISL